MADAEAQYAPLAQEAGAMQRQLAEAQAAAEAAAAEAARLSQELSHSRRALRALPTFASEPVMRPRPLQSDGRSGTHFV